jgi:hypothetical protein
MMNDNASDLTLQPVNDAGLFLLPTRGEKRIIPVPTPSESTISTNTSLSFNPDDFLRQAALDPFYEFISISIPGRGTANGLPDPNSAAVFNFLINPEQVQATRTQLDAQTMARSGWQIGVWGEDLIRITMQGKTPGKYFSNGLTDLMTEYTVSYRNLVALELMVENNGYWFEGEQANEGPLAVDYSRRQIKMHSDVVLTKGEFIWYGMFESMEIDEDADSPYLASFSLSFIAWREHFRSETPYQNPISGSVDFGHAPGVSLAYGNSSNQPGIMQTISATPPQLASTIPLNTIALPPYAAPNSSALLGLKTPMNLPNLPANDETPVLPIMNPTSDLFG